MTWNHTTITTLTEDLIDHSVCDGIDVKLDDLARKSNATIVIGDSAWISNIDELKAGGLEVTIETARSELTLIVPFSEDELHTALDYHLRDMEEQ